MRFRQHLHFWVNFILGKYPLPPVPLTSEEETRIAHYIKLIDPFQLDSSAMAANTVTMIAKTGYAYDWFKMISGDDCRKCYVLFGDIQYTPDKPSFCKSRPISANNQNNVLLPLNTSRHFVFPDDRTPFNKKSDSAVWRGAAYKDLRKNFLKSAADFQLVDAADTSRFSNRNFLGQSLNHLSIKDQLHHKFIFALEGNDVASNLKWVMASNSVPIMPEPQFETWFCESLLIPGQHYIQVDRDFNDLETVLEYYISRPKLSKEIAIESKIFANQFSDIPRQFGLGREVIERYFTLVKLDNAN